MKDEIEVLLDKIGGKYIWDEMPVFCFTADVDWASEDVLNNFFSMVNDDFRIKLTVFVTHDSKVLRDHYDLGIIERGIHPNFLNGSSHGNSFQEVIETCIGFAPEAYGFRSHRLFDVSDITHLLKNEYNYKYVSNLGTVMQKNVQPILHESGLIHFPIFFEDGTHLYNQLDLNFEKYKDNFSSPGLKVICLHPMNMVFNSPTIKYMRGIKDSLTREEYLGIKSFYIDSMSNKHYGIKNTVIDIINFARDNKFPFYTLNEVFNILVSD